MKAVDDDDRGAAEALPEQRGLDVLAVLVAVADDQRAGRLEQRQRDEQLGLAARLQADVVLGAVLDDLLDHVALLVDLDRVHAAVGAAIAVLADGAVEGAHQALDAGGENVGEAHQRRAQAALLEVLHQIEQVDAGALRLRLNLDVALGVGGEEAGAPRCHVVELHAVANRPAAHLLALASLPRRLANAPNIASRRNYHDQCTAAAPARNAAPREPEKGG